MNLTINPYKELNTDFYTAKLNQYNNTNFKGKVNKAFEPIELKDYQSIFKKIFNFFSKINNNPCYKKNVPLLMKPINAIRKQNLDYYTSILYSLQIQGSEAHKELPECMNVLKWYSKDKDLANFVGEVIVFYQRNKCNNELYNKTDGLYSFIGNELDKTGRDVIFLSMFAFEKAVCPNSEVNMEFLKNGIKEAREYMNTYTKEGKIIYPERLPCYKE